MKSNYSLKTVDPNYQGNEQVTIENSEYQLHHQLQSHIILSELPEPPIPLSEIGPIPPPPMFSTPSPTMTGTRPHTNMKSQNANIPSLNLLHPPQLDYNDYDYEEDDSDLYRYPDDADSEEEYILQQNTLRVEEIPVKEPMLNAVPKKSALKKKLSGGGSGPSTPSNQDVLNRPLVVRQDNNNSSSFG